MQMFITTPILRESGATTPATEGSAAVLVVEDCRGGWRGVACDRGVEVTSVSNGSVCGGASDDGMALAAAAAGAGEHVVEVVGCCGEGGAWGLGETAVETGFC